MANPTANIETYTRPSRSDLIPGGQYDIGTYDSSKYDTTDPTYEVYTNPTKNTSTYTNPNKS